MVETCDWSLHDFDSGAYDTACGHCFYLAEETVAEFIAAGAVFCPYCGKRICPVKAQWQIDDEAREAKGEA